MEKSIKFKIIHLPKLLVKTFNNWIDNEPFELSAIVAYYAILSLPALIVIILNVVGNIYGRDIVQGALLDEITAAVGVETAESIRLMMLDRGDETVSIFTKFPFIGFGYILKVPKKLLFETLKVPLKLPISLVVLTA